MKNEILTPETMSKVLDTCYKWCSEGIPGSKTCYEYAEYYMNKYDNNIEIASKHFIKNQKLKCGTSGFASSFGGFAEMAVTLPANITSVIYIQLRMIMTLAIIGGYDINNDDVQTLAFMCVTGTSVSDLSKNAGIKFVNKSTEKIVAKIPREALIKINRFFGFRMVTKFGETGIINLGKFIPLVGAIVGGSIDYFGTEKVARQAYKVFILNKLDD